MARPLVFRVACLVALATPLHADGPAIEHSPVACMIAEQYPRLEATITPEDAVARARVQFRGEAGPWYSVEMTRVGSTFTGVLPQPKASLETVRYSIEATDRQFRANRTAEFEAAVVPSAASCPEGGRVAAATARASVVVGGPAGVAGVPEGFSRDGVVSASGGAGSGSGLGTAGTIGAVLGGAALAGIAIAAATTGGDDGVTTTTLLPGPVPSPSAVPSATTYAGSFTGQRTISGISGPPGCESTTSTLTGTIRITLDTGGAGVAGTAVTMGVGTVAGNTGTCVTVGTRVGDTTPLNWNVPVSGTITNVVFTGVTDGGNGVTETVEFAGTLTGPSIAGTVTFTHRGGPGRFGAVTIPVTLR